MELVGIYSTQIAQVDCGPTFALIPAVKNPIQGSGLDFYSLLREAEEEPVAACQSRSPEVWVRRQ